MRHNLISDPAPTPWQSSLVVTRTDLEFRPTILPRRCNEEIAMIANFFDIGPMSSDILIIAGHGAEKI
jgi:hypothetical protein